jgi:hypothetical protein
MTKDWRTPVEPTLPTTDLAARFEAKHEEAVEAAAQAYYNGMIGSELAQWPHHEGWAGKSEAFKEKVRVHMARALEAAHPAAARLERVRHVKRGFEYEIVGEVEAQVAVGQFDATGGPMYALHDGDVLIVYRALKDGKLWARLKDEFRDGRFETIAEAGPAIATDGTKAVRDVLAERRRQIEVEGCTPEKDDREEREGQMAGAAACYAFGQRLYAGIENGIGFLRDAATVWPWSDEWWKPGDRRRDLVKAGALILAEIERLDRKSQAQNTVTEEKA